MDLYLQGLTIEAHQRLVQARQLAETHLHDRETHRLLMEGVFELEDMLFMLLKMKRTNG